MNWTVHNSSTELGCEMLKLVCNKSIYALYFASQFKLAVALNIRILPLSSGFDQITIIFKKIYSRIIL